MENPNFTNVDKGLPENNTEKIKEGELTKRLEEFGITINSEQEEILGLGAQFDPEVLINALNVEKEDGNDELVSEAQQLILNLNRENQREVMNKLQKILEI